MCAEMDRQVRRRADSSEVVSVGVGGMAGVWMASDGVVMQCR